MQQLIQYIRSELHPRPVTSDEALYERMESQSGYSLPIIYKPFDATQRFHWSDHGYCLDFLAVVGGGDLLDIGPGDGWPSLPVARHARSVTGLDASAKRVAVCEANARRLGLTNFHGVLYRPGEPFPFADRTFDGVMAASSIENAPDPQALLREIYRVLRPGGKFRLLYESPALYAGGKEQELELWSLADGRTYFYLADRNLTAETVDWYCLVLDAPLAEAQAHAQEYEWLQAHTAEAMTYSLRLPSARTWTAWLQEAGFRSVTATHDGGRYARDLFEALDPADRPADLAGVEALLLPGIRVVTGMAAPVANDPLITAEK